MLLIEWSSISGTVSPIDIDLAGYKRLRYHTYLATYAVTLASLDLYSFLAPLLWVLLNLAGGSLQMLIPRTALAKSDTITKEDDFGFGQIISLTLLALPLVAGFEAYYGRSNTNLRNQVRY